MARQWKVVSPIANYGCGDNMRYQKIYVQIWNDEKFVDKIVIK